MFTCKCLKVAVVFAFLVSALAAPADAPVAATAAQIDAYILKYVESGLFNGSILVAKEGQVILKKGYGMANFEWNLPNTSDTRFRIGSITKQFTAALILQLVEEGQLLLEDKLADRLPYYRKDTGSKITIHELLNHTSGIPSYTNVPNIIKEHGRKTMALRDLVTTWCSGDLEFEPGARFAYNNSGYVILGAIIEETTGKSYEQVLAERILGPLGMESSGYDHSETVISRRAGGYDKRLDGFRNAEFVDMSLPHAAGALYSTVEDLFVWDQALQGTKVLSEASKSKMFAPGSNNYGYGWYIRTAPVGPEKAARTVLQHGGSIPGFGSWFVRLPEDGTVIILLNNTGGAPLTAISQGIGDLLYGREPQLPKKPVAPVLYPVIKEKGVEAAVARYREMKAQDPAEYELGERELNQFGYGLLNMGRLDDAIAIFSLNLEAFPQSWNAYDSLAEAYAAKGEKALAIKNYAHSIELNPQNVSGIKKLHGLVEK
jgi:CubicO group peptidase (beta-lactamase class C family)